MIYLNELEEGDVLWHPVLRNVGLTKAPSASSFVVCHIRHDHPTHFLTLVDENERHFTIGVISPSGILESFYKSELEAVKVAVMHHHEDRPIHYESGNIVTPEGWIVNLAKSQSIALYNTVLLTALSVAGGLALLNFFNVFPGR